jgi:hypothetical protein
MKPKEETRRCRTHLASNVASIVNNYVNRDLTRGDQAYLRLSKKHEKGYYLANN